MPLYQVIASIAATRSPWHSSIQIPTFWVDASCSESAVDKAELIVFADRRTDDGVMFELNGSVIRDADRDDYLAFHIAMVRPDGVTRETHE